MNDALSQMIAALELEIAAVRKGGGGTKVQLHDGERVGRAEGLWLYRFLLSEDLHLRDETPVRVYVGAEDVSGILVSFRDGIIVVALEKDLGQLIPSARLETDDSFLIERLKERLEQVARREAQFNEKAAQQVLGLRPARVSEADPHPAVWPGVTVNSSQITAIRQALGSEIEYLWGPPGTGKTTTLARIVEAYYRAGRSILLVSNTNIAVDTALQAVAERLVHEDGFDAGLVLRLGPIVKEELLQTYGSHLVVEEIVKRLGEQLSKEREQLITEAAPLQAKEKVLSGVLDRFSRLETAERNFTNLTAHVNEVRATLARHQREVDRLQALAEQYREALERARTMGAVRRFFAGLNPELLKRNIEATERARRGAEQAARETAKRLEAQASQLRALEAEIREIRLETAPYSETEVRTQLSTVREQLSRITNRMAAIEAELAKLEEEVLARCRILATTVYRTYLGQRPLRQFDVVVIDEASMLMPPLVYCVAGLALQSVVVAGDFRQLPPIVMSSEPLATEWLQRDVFEIAGIPQQLEKRSPPPTLVGLNVQHRMLEPICSVLNEFFYADHPLETGRTMEAHDTHPFGSSPLVYVDTAPFHPWAAMPLGTYSRYNLFHGLLIRNMVLSLLSTDSTSETQADRGVGVVSPYAAQARLIQALLEDRLGRTAAGISATVHRFQGNEKSVMLIDLTDSLGARLSRFLKATHLKEDGARLLNVAISRARDQVVLVANFEYLRAKAPHTSYTRKLLDYFERHGTALDVSTLLPAAESEWIDGLRHVLPSTFELEEGAAGAFTEHTFYPAFLQDLARARESIVVFSPFATAEGTARWVEPLRSALARGVRVRILMRPPDDWGGGSPNEVAEVIRALRSLGIVVDLRARMHEKVAIIDEHLLWLGSLNILSHRDTSESMLRLDSPSACEQVAKLLTVGGAHTGETRKLVVSENLACPICDGPTVLNTGRYGIYFVCENRECQGKVDLKSRGRAFSIPRRARRSLDTSPASSVGDAEKDPVCPRCGGVLRERYGRYGPFLGCSNYPRCRYTERTERRL